MKYRAAALILASAASLTCAAAAAAQQPAALRHIRGQVLSAQGTPVEGANICARPLSPLRGRLPCAVTGGEGRFSIPVEASETYFLTAGKAADGYPDSGSPFYRVPFVNLPQVVVAPDGPAPPEVTFHLGYTAARLGLHVTDAETGQAVRQARIRLCRLEPPKYCSSLWPQAAGDLYTVLVPPAPVSVEVSAAGYESWDADGPLRMEAGSASELSVALSKEGPGGSNRPALPAPAQTSPADGAVFEYFPRTTVLEWRAVPGAASYTVEVEFFNVCPAASCPETSPHQINGDPPQSGIEETRYEFNFIGAQRGRWRVRAVDAEGRAGARSPWATFAHKR